MPHALRKSYGPFSAGTRIDILCENDDKTCQVQVLLEYPASRNYDLEEQVFDVPFEDIVSLRPKTDSVPVRSRRERRAVINELFAGTKPSREEV